MSSDMRILRPFVEGEAVSIGGEDFVVSDVREGPSGDLQLTFERKPFITIRPEDERA